MNWLSNLWALGKGGRNARLANIVWNEGLWNWWAEEDTKREWVASGGGLGKQWRSRLEHPASHRVLGRHAVVDTWLPKMNCRMVTDAMKRTNNAVELWSKIEHRALWEKLAVLFREEEAKDSSKETAFTAAWKAPWQRILMSAGACGNLEPFLVASRLELYKYHQSDKIPHPKVGLWLVEKGIFTLDKLRDSVTPAAYPMASTRCQNFGGNLPGEPMVPEFAAECCALQLEHYGLSLEQKIRFVGHMFLLFGKDAWLEHIEPRCAPYMEGINKPMLYAACGTFVHGVHNPDEYLYKTIRLLSQDAAHVYDPEMVVDLSCKPRYGEVDKSIVLSLQLAPPQDRVELYFFGCQVERARQQMEAGLSTIELPELG